MTTTLLFIAILVSVIFGYIFGLVSRKGGPKSIGNLRIDQSDPEEGPYIFLELDSSIVNMDSLMKSKQVVLDVVVKDYITQK